MISPWTVIFFCAAVGAGAASADPVLHEEPALPCTWRKVAHFLEEQHPVTVRLALKQRNLEKLKSLAASISDPRSASYGQYMSTAEIRRMTAPDPEHIKVIERWLADAGVPFNRLNGGETIEVQLSVATASKLFNTKFHHAFNDETNQHKVRAGDYWLPLEIHEATAAVYGMHGVPTPWQNPLQSQAGPSQPPAVTPAVLHSTYQISGVKISSVTNRQAVAEFQGQTTNATDLAAFFREFVASAPVTDDKVYKFVGNNGSGTEGVEAGLDIEYIMGVAPGIQTEFWYWAGDDFCADLKNWTDTILADDNAPLVHSVSYGYQGPLDELGCKDVTIEDVDANFVKLAAKGITIIFASGDSGSGYTPSCAANAQAVNKSVTGTVFQNISVMSAAVCCQAASQFPAWTFTPPPRNSLSQCSPKSGEAFEGKLVAYGSIPNEADCCMVASSGQYPGVKGYTFVSTSNGGNCSLFGSLTGSKSEPSATSSRVSPPMPGICTAFQTVTGTSVTAGDVSGGDAVKPVAPKLYPSWPASSQWVTSVGATRFINQKVGQPEMASDQFGSGGGFSTMFTAFKDQVDAVEHYLNIATDLPPKGSYPPGGRATPDISALGEGYQVLANGLLNAVGGTSASTPAFGAMVSLINEARLKAGKKPMGYLNPFLYQNAAAFTDVTVGTNAIGRGTGPTKYGFKCAKGWDPATGLGTPIFPKLLEAALAVGPSTIVI